METLITTQHILFGISLHRKLINMKKVLLFFSLLIPIICFSQTSRQYIGTTNNIVQARGGLMADSSFYIGRIDTTFIPDRVGCLVQRPQNNLFYVYQTVSGITKWYELIASNGGGIQFIYSADAPTNADTTKLWIQTPDNNGVYDVFIYVTEQFSWNRFGWLSVDGVFSFKPPLNIIIAGQSNAGGIYSGGDTARVSGIIGYTTGAINLGIDAPTHWGAVNIGLSPFFISNNNIAWAFAKEAKRQGVADIVRIIAAYKGGTGLGVWASTDSTYMLDSLRNRLTRSGIDTIHAFLWCQGENGATVPTSSGGYFTQFSAFLDSLYLKPQTPGIYQQVTRIIAVGPGTDTSFTGIFDGASPIGAQRRLNQDRRPFTAYYPAWGKSLCDAVHFCGTALDSLGRGALYLYKIMPRGLAEEEPQFTYDYVNDKQAYGGVKVSSYQNGLAAQNIQGINVGLINNSSILLSINGNNGDVLMGASTSYTTTSPVLSINGRALIESGNGNSILAGNINLSGGAFLRNTFHGNYVTNMNQTNAGTDNSFYGYSAGQTTATSSLYNTSVFGANALRDWTGNGGVAGSFVTCAGTDALRSSTGGGNTAIGARSGRTLNGKWNSILGYDALSSSLASLTHTGDYNTALGYAVQFNSTTRRDSSFSIGAFSKIDTSRQGVLGDSSMIQLKIAGVHRLKTNATPSNGQTWLYNSTSGLFEFGNPGTAYAFNNGLTNTSGTVQLGGTLVQNTTINTGGFTSTWTGSNDSETSFSVANTGATNAHGISGSATGTSSIGVTGTSTSYLGVYGSSTSNNGVQGESSSGSGVVGISATGVAFRGQTNPISTDAIENVASLLRRSSSGAGANGLGAAIQVELETATNGTSQTAGSFGFKWTDATNATRTSQAFITAVDTATTNTVATYDGDGTYTTIGKRIIKVITNSDGTLTLGNAHNYVFTGTTTTWTLPAVSGTTGLIYYIKNRGSGAITLNADSGSNEIYDTAAANTYNIAAGAAITIISDGTYFNVYP